MGPLAGRLPGFAVVAHVGRRSGRAYRTPANLFETDGRPVVALTYGADSQWVRNVLGAGGVDPLARAALERVEREVVHDPQRALISPPAAGPGPGPRHRLMTFRRQRPSSASAPTSGW